LPSADTDGEKIIVDVSTGKIALKLKSWKETDRQAVLFRPVSGRR